MEQLLIIEDDIGLNQGLSKALKADDRQAAYGFDLPGQKGHRRARSDDDRIVLRHEGRGGGTDRPLLGDVLLLFLVDVAIADIRAYKNGAAMRPVEFLLLFEVGQVLADGHFRNLEKLGELCHRNRAVLLQQRQNTAVPFRKAQKWFFTWFVHAQLKF